MRQTLILIWIAVTSLLSLSAADIISEKDIDKVISKMTLEQKARILVGTPGYTDIPNHKVEGAAGWTYSISSLGIPSINLADGPVGIRINPVSSPVKIVYDEAGIPILTTEQDNNGKSRNTEATTYCTCFPSTTALAATWNKEAALLQGKAMGEEAKCYGVDIILTPGINIMRNPLCGRNFEYYSEDPILTGKMAASIIQGIQSKGIGTSLKHFVANNQQTGKKYNDARMTQRALREIYLKAFEICVKEAKPWTVMGSYNKIAGDFTQTNKELMVSLLRDEWKFDGLVLTDWTVRRPTPNLLNARCALMMPGEEEIVQEIMDAVKSGQVSESTLNACVKDVLKVVAKSVTANGWTASMPDLQRNANLSHDIATESMVLLKNNNSALPLKNGSPIALFGATAYKSIAGGTGSSNVNKAYVTDIARGLENAGFSLNARLKDVYTKYAAFQNEILDKFPDCPEWQKLSYHRTVLPEMDFSGNTEMIAQEIQKSSLAIVVLGRGSGETSDRTVANDFNLTPAEQSLLKNVSDACRKQGKKMIVVMNVCGMMEMATWNDLPDAILMAWFPGQECGDAIADILTGKVNPSGRLPMTFPRSYYDIPSSKNYPYIGQTAGKNFDYTNYEEDIWVGYRYFSTAEKEVVYPFGYGLSYTTFEYTSPKIVRKNDGWQLSVTVTNTGQTAGKEVVQAYIKAPAGNYPKPTAELKAFAKTGLLQPGESETLSLSFSDYDLASFDEQHSQWKTDKGDYTVILGASAEKAILSVPFRISKTRCWKTGNILAPVVPVNTLDMEKEKAKQLTYYNAADFKILGKIYTDSLPTFSRVPNFRKDNTREALWKLGQHSAGISVRFRSNSPKIGLRWENLFGNSMTHMADLATRGLDLYTLVDGKWRYIGCGRPMNETYGTEEWLVIDNIEKEMREYMLHLPLYDGIKSLEIGIAKDCVIEMPSVNSPQTEKPLVIYGSSIAHGATASRPGMAASNQLQRLLNREVINLGFSANAHIDYEIAEMMADTDALAYVLDFVPNATVDEIQNKTEKFIQILRKKHPNVPLIFIEDPQFAHAILDKNIAAEIKAKNEALQIIYAKLKESGVKNLYYIKSEQLLPEDGDGTSDGIHFTDMGFHYYTKALMPILNDITTNQQSK